MQRKHTSGTARRADLSARGESRSIHSDARSCPQAVERLERRLLLAAHVVGRATGYSTIQAAVNAAPTAATVTVDAGTYPELVTINKTLTLQGAQAGIDGRGP